MTRDSHNYYRGEIYYAYLDPSFGHEQGGMRPVLILQNDVGNYYSPTLIVAAATGHTKKLAQPTHVSFANVNGLPVDTTFMLEVLRTIDKRRIRSYAGRLTQQQMSMIDAALKVSLRLEDEDCFPVEPDAP